MTKMNDKRDSSACAPGLRFVDAAGNRVDFEVVKVSHTNDLPAGVNEWLDRVESSRARAWHGGKLKA